MPSRASVGLACLAAAVLAAGCWNSFDVRKPPKDVVEPTAIGLWQSETTTGQGLIHITLQSGATFTLDQGDRLSFGYGDKRDSTTLIIVGPGEKRPWYVVAQAALASDVFPAGCHPVNTGLFYDEPGAVVILLDSTGGTAWLPFGIRFKKGMSRNLATPPSYVAPFYGDLARLCLDDVGQVSFIDP
jgi:hypothetical protein